MSFAAARLCISAFEALAFSLFILFVEPFLPVHDIVLYWYLALATCCCLLFTRLVYVIHMYRYAHVNRVEFRKDRNFYTVKLEWPAYVCWSGVSQGEFSVRPGT